MSLGIRVFGMTPFGWRCVCALFGILMVPVSYAFMRKISRSTWIASFAALLIVFDFMHFTLSRIGTIDVIVGFFILLTFYLMYLVLDDLKTDIVEVKLWDKDTAGAYPAVREECYIEVVSYGGDTTGYQIPFNVHYTGVKTKGTFDPAAKKFTQA